MANIRKIDTHSAILEYMEFFELSPFKSGVCMGYAYAIMIFLLENDFLTPSNLITLTRIQTPEASKREIQKIIYDKKVMGEQLKKRYLNVLIQNDSDISDATKKSLLKLPTDEQLIYINDPIMFDEEKAHTWDETLSHAISQKLDSSTTKTTFYYQTLLYLLQAIKLFHEHDKFPFLFKHTSTHYKLNLFDKTPIIQLLTPTRMTLSGEEIRSIKPFSGVYTIQELTQYLTIFRFRYKEHVWITGKNEHDNIVFIFSSNDHKIAIAYHCPTNEWLFADINYEAELPQDDPVFMRTQDDRKLAKSLFEGFFEDQHAILSTQIFVKEKIRQANQQSTNHINKTWFDEFLKFWSSNGQMRDMHRVTPEKAKMIDARGGSWLHFAAELGNKDQIYLLLENGANAHLQSKKSDTPFLAAVLSRNTEVVKVFLNHPSVNPSDKTNTNISAIGIATKLNDLEMVKLLLSHDKINPNELINATFQIKNKLTQVMVTPLIYASCGGYESVVHCLLAHPKINVNLTMSELSALHWAVKKGHISIVKLLLQHPDIDPNSVDVHGNTPLHLATLNNDIVMVKLLLENPKVNKNMTNNYYLTAFDFALEYDFSILQTLLSDEDVSLDHSERMRKSF